MFSSLRMDENCTGEDDVEGLGVDATGVGALGTGEEGVVGGREETGVGEDVPLLSALLSATATDAATGADGCCWI